MVIAKNDQLQLKVSTREDWVNTRPMRQQIKSARDYSLPTGKDEVAEAAWWEQSIRAGRSSSYSIFSQDDQLLGLIRTFNHNEAVKGMETVLELFENTADTIGLGSLRLFLDYLTSNTNYRRLLTLVNPANTDTIALYESLGFENLGEDTDLEDDSKVFVKLGYQIQRSQNSN